MAPVLIDQVNGFLYKEYASEISVSQVFKFMYIGLFTLIGFLSLKSFVPISVLVLALLLGVVNGIFFYGSPFLFSDVVFISKILMFPLSFYFFNRMFSKVGFGTSFKIIKYVNGFIFINLFLALVASVVGFGMSNYGTTVDGVGYGFKGYFIAGNELGALFILIYSFTYYFSLKDGKLARIWLVAFLGLLSALLIVTKTAIISYFVITFSTPIVVRIYQKKKLTVLTKLDRNYLVTIAVIAVFLMPAIYLIFQDRIGSNVERLNDDLNKAAGVASFIISGRDEKMTDSFKYLELKGLAGIVFGSGWNYPQRVIQIEYGSEGSSETDWVDIMVGHGILGLVAIYGFWFVRYIKVLGYVIGRGPPEAVPAAVALTLLISNSLIAGHIIYSAMLGLYLGAYLSFVELYSKIRFPRSWA